MSLRPLDILTDEIVVKALQQAWRDSNPGESGGHEEGGFILLNSTGGLSVERWPYGNSNQIVVPVHENCKYNGLEIVASFHTHPNTGGDYIQVPSMSDIDGVCDDSHLKGPHYIGELVVSGEWVYLIQPNGNVLDLEETTQVMDQL